MKADSPFFPAVVREDEPSLESESSCIVMFSLCALNSEEQRGATEMLKAVKLVSAARHSIAELKRALNTDLITVALRKCLVQGKLQGTPYKCKNTSEDAEQLDSEVRNIVSDFYNQWKAELYVNEQGILCCRRKSSEIA